MDGGAQAGSRALVGYFDSFEDGVARGWTFDARDPHRAQVLHVIIDGQEVATVTCDEHRADVRASLDHPTGNVGFRFEVPLALLDGEPHRIGFRFPNRFALAVFDPADAGAPRTELAFSTRLKAGVQGYVDGLRQGQLHGWAVRVPPRSGRREGGCQVLVTCEGRRVALARADRYRGDVAAMLACDPQCGFAITLPPAFRKPFPQPFRVEVVPEGVELGGSPAIMSAVTDQLEGTLLDISDRMDRLFRDFVALRRKVQDAVPRPGHTLADYDRWARAYYADLSRRVAAGRAARRAAGGGAPEPLVSILCPTYKPLLSDFVAAVESVLAQTYRNWELVIVDDASRSPELSAQIKAFCARDKRVRSVVRRRNGNISEATNTAIAEARGEWMAFFDHDDLLVPEAIEVMVAEAARTGARMLYSDEDKVDQAGYFLEPNLKPDWNHRYLLGCNYVCHLLFVAADDARAAGPLHGRYNGAQDHDFVLRLSELLPDERIHHVPEVLYHWRKTVNSTAADLSNKGYAVEAGVAAVADHLARLGTKAEVAPVNGLTLYRVTWRNEATPSVCVVIPFRDQAEMTGRCLDRLLSLTEYDRLRVVLVDNWSTSAEAARLVERAAADPRVRVLRVEEEFNYSRLNNLAVAGTDADCALFMNNDVLVSDPAWLRTAVGELTADDRVAVVGCKLLYPNNTVQHAGVVVGGEGIAAHVHRAAPFDDYGYIGRAVLSHEVTAVTAACLLIRADVFRAVGGFDEETLRVAYNDVDLCLKVRAAGHKVVWSAETVAEHHESFSRGSDDRPEHEARFFHEQQAMLDRWGSHPLFARDPAYSPHFTVDLQPFFDLVPPGSPKAAPPAS